MVIEREQHRSITTLPLQLRVLSKSTCIPVVMNASSLLTCRALCACAPQAIDVGLLHDVESTVDAVVACAPSSARVSFMCVVHRTGEVVVLRHDPGTNPARVLSMVPALKRAAAAHASTLRAREVSSIRVASSSGRSHVAVWERSGTCAIMSFEMGSADAPRTTSASSLGAQIAAGSSVQAGFDNFGDGGGGWGSDLDGRVRPLMQQLHQQVETLMHAVAAGPDGR